MKAIHSLQNPLIKDLLLLHQPKYRKEQQLFLVEGYHLVEEAIRSKRIQRVLITDTKDTIDGIENILVTYDVIKKLSMTKTPQKVMGVCRIQEEETSDAKRVLMLDGIQDPGNMGTLIRTAAAFSCDVIYCSYDCVDIYNDKVIRATQGAIFHISIIRGSLSEVIKKYQSQGITIIGTNVNQATMLSTFVKPKSYALVLGNEARGISEALTSLVDVNVKIEINQAIESLNVAVAGAIILHYLK